MSLDRLNRSSIAASTPPLINAVITLMNELVEIMTAEPELVMGRKFEAHQQLLKRKQKLTLEYRTYVKSIAAQPELLKQLPDETCRKLKLAGQRLADSAERNGRMLRAAVTAVQRLVQNIVSIVKSEVLPKAGYKNPQTAYLELGTYSPTCTPVAVRRSV